MGSRREDKPHKKQMHLLANHLSNLRNSSTKSPLLKADAFCHCHTVKCKLPFPFAFPLYSANISKLLCVSGFFGYLNSCCCSLKIIEICTSLRDTSITFSISISFSNSRPGSTTFSRPWWAPSVLYGVCLAEASRAHQYAGPLSRSFIESERSPLCDCLLCWCLMAAAAAAPVGHQIDSLFSILWPPLDLMLSRFGIYEFATTG